MAIFTAIAGAIVGALGLTGIVATVATSLIAGGLALGVSRLIAPRGPSGNSQQEDAISGGRVQLPPATNNKLPVVYGTAFVGGPIVDAKISTDLQTMWYVIALAEVTNTMPGNTADTITFDELYYDGKTMTLSGAQVTSLTTNTAGTPEVDTKINGNLFVYLFPNGSSSGTNTGGQTAIDIMSDSAIPADQRWNQGIYTAGGQSATMTNTAFVIVKVKYNQDAGTTSLGAVTAKITNSRTKPGDCIKDYLLNDRYGCAVPTASINNASITALNDYSDKTIVYTPMGGGSPTTQVRYRFNGPLDTTKNCLANLQDMVDACDSWMQYSELTGQWKVVINKAYDETPNALTFNDLYSVTNNNLTSGISVNPTDLNQTFNQVEYQYPNTNIKDQLDFIFIALQDDYPSLLSENEPVNKLSIKNDLVNNYVQAKFIAIRRILQGREDLIITLQTDYSGIQVEAGDVIRVTNEVYGWTNKLFRVSNVVEEKDADGNLFARLTAFEYNGAIYDDDLDITDYIPADNTGLQNPNIISIPTSPIVIANTNTTLNFLNVSANAPNSGLVTHLDFHYGFDSNVSNHKYYTTITNSNGAPLVNSQTYSIQVNDISTSGNIYWSTTAKNRTVGIQSNVSTGVVWPGANVSIPVGNVGGITGNNIQSNTITGNNIVAGTIDASKINVTALSAITANVGVLTAGTIQNVSGSYVIDVTNGRALVQVTGGYMKVTGNVFGSTNQFIDWYGPFFPNLSSCTETNAIYYLKTNGQAYFGGSISSGILKNAVQTTSLASNASVETGPYGSNGGTIVITLSYNASSNTSQVSYPATTTGLNNFNAAVAAWGTTPIDGVVNDTKTVSTGGTTTVDLNRALGTSPTFTNVTTLTVTDGEEQIVGIQPVVGDSPGYLQYFRSFTQSITYTDNLMSTTDRNYQSILTARGTGILPYSGNQKQQISFISIEQ